MTSSTELISNLVLPTLLHDIIGNADKWGNDGESGIIDPFTEIYDVSPILQNEHFGGRSQRLSFLARFRHDRPYGYMP